jgi:hypothetical protein
MSGISKFKRIYSEGVSFDIGSGHNAAKRKAKIANLAAGTTNPGERAAAKNKLKGPKLPSMKKEETELDERHMTAAEKRKEEALGKKTASAKEAMMKEYGPDKGEKIYYAWKRKKAMSEDISMDEAYCYVIETLVDADFAQDYETAENMFEHISDEFVAVILEDYIEEKARGTRPKRTVHAYDVDETLFSHGKKGKPNVQVHVKDASGKRVQSLSNQEFNTHKLPKGHSYDFSEFQSAKKFTETSSPNKKIIADLKRRQARGQNVHLITARSKFDNPSEFKGHLEKHGIKTPMSNIHYTGGMKGGDIGVKKVTVASAVAKKSGTKSMHMHDDAAKVHKAFEAEKKNKPTSTKIKTHMIKPNKSGEPTSRSYQATKEDFELWVNALIDEGYDLSEFTIDELYEGYEEFLGEASTMVATAAPEPHRPKKEFTSPYKNKKLPPKKYYKEDLTPYEFWMNIIETQQPEATEEVVEEENDEIVEEGPITSYQKWKQYLEEAPGTLEKVGSTLGAKVGGFIGQNRGTSTGIPGAGTIGKVIGSDKGSDIGGRIGKTADTVVSNLRQTKSISGGTSTRPGDGKPYADGPLWDGPSKTNPQPKKEAPNRNEPLW